MQALAVGGGSGGVVGVDLDDLPVAGLGFDERTELGLLRFEAVGLVVLVGGTADVDGYPPGEGFFDLPDAVRGAGFLSHLSTPFMITYRWLIVDRQSIHVVGQATK
nr:hypothetical protein [uncultured Actinoplanes sp.]